MSREAAKMLLELALKHCAEQDAALASIQESCSPEEFKRYRLMIGKSMGAMLIELINPIVWEYPDLRPPELLKPD